MLQFSNILAQPNIELSTNTIDLDTFYFKEYSKEKYFTIYNRGDKAIRINPIKCNYDCITLTIDKREKYYLKPKDSVIVSVKASYCKNILGSNAVITLGPLKHIIASLKVKGFLAKREGVYEQYWENGNIRIKGYYKEGYKDSLWTEWFKEGEIKSKGVYKSACFSQSGVARMPFGNMEYTLPDITSRKIGEWITYYQNGNKSTYFNYNKIGKLNGKQFSWYKNGMIKSEKYFINGYRQGKQIEFYSNGKQKNISYQNGGDECNRYGIWKSWNEYGSKIKQIEYDTLKHSFCKTRWYGNGNIKSQCYYYYDCFGKWKNGTCKEWYENSKNKKSENYIKGNFDGIQEYYYKNGNLQQQFEYQNGKQIGIWKYWDEFGVLVKEKDVGKK